MKKSRLFTVAPLSLALIASLAGCGAKDSTAPQKTTGTTSQNSSQPSSAASGKQIVIKLSNTIPEGQPITEASKKFAQIVDEKSNHTIKVQVYPYNQLGDENAVEQQVKQGSIQMSIDSASTVGNIVPNIGVMDAPYVWKDFESLKKITNGPLFDPIRAELEKNGVKLLSSSWYFGTRVLSSNVPINKPEDAKGIKLRTPPAPTNLLSGKVLGGNPTPLNPQELYTALKQHVIDAQENPLSFIDSTKLYEVQKYITLTNHILQSQVVIMNLSFWNSLTKEQQDIIQNALNEAGDYEYKLAQENDQKMLEKYKTMKEITFNEKPDIEAFRKNAETLVPASGLPWVDLYKKIQEQQK